MSYGQDLGMSAAALVIVARKVAGWRDMQIQGA